jgi:hypothetical protein
MYRSFMPTRVRDEVKDGRDASNDGRELVAGGGGGLRSGTKACDEAEPSAGGTGRDIFRGGA